MTTHATAYSPGYRSPWTLAFIAVVLAECLWVFGWSLEFPAFVAFGLGTGALGLFDRWGDATDRLVAAWLITATVVLVVGAALLGDGGTELVRASASAIIVGSLLAGLRLAHPGGIALTDVASGCLAAFALGSLGWAPVAAAAVGALAGSGVVAAVRVIRTGERSHDPVPFSAILAGSSLIAIGLGL